MNKKSRPRMLRAGESAPVLVTHMSRVPGGIKMHTSQPQRHAVFAPTTSFRKKVDFRFAAIILIGARRS